MRNAKVTFYKHIKTMEVKKNDSDMELYGSVYNFI